MSASRTRTYARMHATQASTYLALACAVLLASGCATIARPAPGPRPASWARPVAAHAGLPNLHRVSATLYRSAQPTREGFAFLSEQPNLDHADRPIKTVVSLRLSDGDAPLVAATSPLRLEQIRFKPWRPTNEDVVKFLRIATTPVLQPVLVHCKHGSDRTGVMVAIYRVAYEGWTKEQATSEMIGGGFGFHPIWKNLLRYLNALDVDAIKQQVAKQGAWR